MWWRSPWLPVGLAPAPVLVTAWAASPPGGYFGLGLLAVGLWALVCLVTVVVGVLGVVALPRPRTRHLGRLLPLLLIPALLVGDVLLARSGVVAGAVFDTHRTALDRLAAEVQKTGAVTDRDVGLFSISSASTTQNCVVLAVADAGGFASAGYARCAGPAPTSARGDGYRFTPIDGAWYEFRFTF